MNTTTSPHPAHPEKAVFRNLALPVSVFDYIKDTQRSREATHAARLSISQAVSQIIREHQTHSTPERHCRSEWPRHSEVQNNVPALFISR